MNQTTKSILRIVLPLLLGVVLLWLLYRNTKWEEVKQVLESNVNYGILGFSLLFGFMSNVVRGLRWNLLVPPVVPPGEPKPRLINAVLTVLGSYTINMGIPRAGELWRCAEYKRYEDINFSSLFGTLINDRLADVISLAIILFFVLIGNQDFFLGFFAENPEQLAKLEGLLYSPWLYVAAALGILALVGLFLFLRKRPNNKIAMFVRSILEGIASIRSMEKRGLFIFYSLLIWVGYFFYFYTTFFAFPFTQNLSLSIALIAFALSSMSALAPVQAGMGPWHFMVITSLVAYGVSRQDAGAFALIVHTTQTLWITLVGLIAIILLPFINRGYKRIAPTAEHS